MLLAGSILLMTVHFLAVDVAMAGPLFCIWLARGAARRGDALAGRLDVALARASLAALAVGIVVGGLELVLLAGDHDFWRAVAAVAPSRLWFSLAELIFFALCMAGYLRLAGRPVRRPKLAATLALLASLDVMYHFPPLFTMLNLLADRPGLAGATLDSPRYRSLMLDPEVLGMTAHVCLAAIAVTAVFVMHRVAAAIPSEEKPGGPTDRLSPIASGAAGAALVATLLQLPVGVGVVLSVPSRLGHALMGNDLPATVAFAGGILATLGLLHHLAAVAFGDPDRRQVRRSVVLMLVTVLLMTATLQRIRELGRLAAQPGDSAAAARGLAR